MFTLAVGPLSVVASQSGLPDKAGVYLVFEFGSSASLTRDMSSSGAQELGPIRPPLSRMILASQTAHDQLQTSGYTMIPASALAALCGIEIPKINQVPRI
ncbi:hypothetical protein RLO149_c033060 [Roseobacter litoralis Och 149]|uniref:Uncharacterized protein n=1 Tax=Roseobacter litoralis (strain ATCC 49566 / DSM 6996 / JCM 21268 / NBRC 15278 / OCh 149) TaxID=391595 RepID=F7ZL44_ROSLO|nr:hypothetical protein RLO149_c033060 [Roseobacter litoralis Och 149]